MENEFKINYFENLAQPFTLQSLVINNLKTKSGTFDSSKTTVIYNHSSVSNSSDIRVERQIKKGKHMRQGVTHKQGSYKGFC